MTPNALQVQSGLENRGNFLAGSKQRDPPGVSWLIHVMTTLVPGEKLCVGSNMCWICPHLNGNRCLTSLYAARPIFPLIFLLQHESFTNF